MQTLGALFPLGDSGREAGVQMFPVREYTHSSCVCTKVTGQQPHRAASFSSPEVFSPLQGKTAFRADGEGAAGRRGRHSQPGCVEFFLKTRSLNRLNINFKNTSPPQKRRSGTHLCAFENTTNSEKATLATSMARQQRARRWEKKAPVNCSNIQETTTKDGSKERKNPAHGRLVHTDGTHGG